MYSMQYLSTLGSDPWVPVISRRPVASRRRVEARPSHKSHLSKMRLAPATHQGPGPGPSPSLASVTHAGLLQSKANLPPASVCLYLYLLLLLLLPFFALCTRLQQPHGLLT